MSIIAGQRVSVTFANRQFDVIVIDPNGLGQGQPSVGFGFRMMEKNAGIPQATLSNWVVKGDSVIDGKFLKLPSGKLLRVIDLVGLDNNPYTVIEVADWFDMCVDLLIEPGRTSKGLKPKIGNFLKWFGVKGFYAETYTALKGVYSAKDSRATTQWLNDRMAGIPYRKLYTDFLQSQNVEGKEYATWTNVIYLGLFGYTSKQMIEVWECKAGSTKIARNHIPQSEGLKAVAYCENLVVTLFADGDTLEDVHKAAIFHTRRKFRLDTEAA